MLPHALFMHPSAIFQWPQNTAFPTSSPSWYYFPISSPSWSIYLSLTPSELLGNRRVCVCVCARAQVCLRVCLCCFASASTGAEFYWTVEQVWILQLDHISERDTESDNGTEFFTVESSTIATSNKEEEEGLVFGVIFSVWDGPGGCGQKAGASVRGSAARRQTCFPGASLRCPHPPPGLQLEWKEWLGSEI